MMAFASGGTLTAQDRDSEDRDRNTLVAVFVMTNASNENEVIPLRERQMDHCAKLVGCDARPRYRWVD